MELANTKLAELAAEYEENARDGNYTQRVRRYYLTFANFLDNAANTEALDLEKVAKELAAEAEAIRRHSEELIKETRGISGDFALMAHTAERAAERAADAALYYEAAGRVAEIAKAVKDAEGPEKYKVRYIAKDGAVLSYVFKTDAAFRLYHVRNRDGVVLPNTFASAMREAEARFMANPDSSMARHGGVNVSERCAIEQLRTGRTEYFQSYFAGIGH